MKKFLASISIVFLTGCSVQQQETKDIFLIPEGFEGTITVFYNVEGDPPLKKEGEYSVIPAEVKSLPTLRNTEIERYGIARTSTKEVSHGIVNNKYYYINENGERTRLDEDCAYEMGNGKFSGTGIPEISYQQVQITNRFCGEKFQRNGDLQWKAQGDEIVKYWMSTYQAERE